MAALTEQQIARCAQYWRALPHTYAERCSHGRWTAYYYLKYLSKIVFEGVRRGNARIMVNAPPRHCKSEFLSFWTSAWFLDTFPEQRVILTAYGDELARDFGRKVKGEFESNDLCLAALREDSHAAGRWETPQGGGMICAGVNGPLAGRGFNLGIVTDPVKNWHEAHSRVYQRRLREWMGSTFLTRAEPHASVIVEMQRWTDDDLCGWLAAEHPDDWQIIRLPALAEGADPVGRELGEPLCPDRFDLDALRKKRREVGATIWAACYQQAPSEAREGLVYPNYSDRNVSKKLELRDDLALDLSLDPGARTHIGCVVGQQDERLDELYAVHEIHGPDVRCSRDAAEAFCAFVKTHGGWRWPRLRLYGDPTAHDPGRSTATYEADWTVFRKVVRRHYPDIRVSVRTPRKTIPLADSITTYNEALRDVENVVHYMVHPRCERLLRDLKRLRLAEDGGIDKGGDPEMSHCSDAERYRVWCCRRLRIRDTEDDYVGQLSVG